MTTTSDRESWLEAALTGAMPTSSNPKVTAVRLHDGETVRYPPTYIVSEISGSGLQVFDLRRLLGASTDTPTVFTSDAAYDGFGSAHNISVNQEADVAYVVGSNTCCANGEDGGLHMVDISRSLAPRFAGCA